MAQHSQGYLFAGPLTTAGSIYTYWGGNYVNLGGGGEAALGRSFTLGGEVAGLISTRERFARNAAVLTVGPACHFVSRSARKLDPFVAGGFSLLVSRGVQPALAIGAGANYWFQERLGLRLEFRDHIWASEGATIQFYGARFGLAFR